MFENFSTNALQIIDDALQIARSLNKNFVGSEHLLLAMYQKEDTICRFLLNEKHITYDDINNTIKNLIILKKEIFEDFTYTKKFQEIILYAEKFAKDLNSKYVYDEHIFYVMLREYDSIACVVLEKLGIDLDEMMIDIEEIFNFFKDEEISSSSKEIPYPFLTNLTSKEKIHPFVKRKDYIEKICFILSKKQKNNPLLIGNAGVGKTAIIEGLSHILTDQTIYQLDLGNIIAGTKYRGELEEKIAKAMEYIKSKKAILFIDEIHNIVGAGSNDGTLDIANILKPYLSRSEIKLIGSTTLDEYYRFIEKDKALTRRFQNIFIDEPSEQETYQILDGIKASYEQYHHVSFSNHHLKQIIKKTKYYLLNKNFPDKAIDVLDEVGSRRQYSNKSIDNLIDEVIENMTALKPIGFNNLKIIKLNYDILKPYYLKFIKKEELKLNPNNIGTINVEANFNPKALIEDLKKVFNFKEEMYLEIDLANFQDITTINNLIGSSKGYVGYEQGGILCEHIIKYPMSLIYFKNFNKAHYHIQDYLTSIMKKPFLTDNKNRNIYLNNCLFLIEQLNNNSHKTGFINQLSKGDGTIMLKNIKIKDDNIDSIKLLNKYHILINNINQIKKENLADVIAIALLKGKGKYHYNLKDKILEPLNN